MFVHVSFCSGSFKCQLHCVLYMIWHSNCVYLPINSINVMYCNYVVISSHWICVVFELQASRLDVNFYSHFRFVDGNVCRF